MVAQNHHFSSLAHSALFFCGPGPFLLPSPQVPKRLSFLSFISTQMSHTNVQQRAFGALGSGEWRGRGRGSPCDAYAAGDRARDLRKEMIMWSLSSPSEMQVVFMRWREETGPILSSVR